MQNLHHYLAHQSGGPTVLLQDGATAREPQWLLFRDPVAILVAERLSDVLPVLAEIEAQTEAGRWAAGFLSYEAAPALDPALAAFEAQGIPLAWWGIFEAPRALPLEIAAPITAPAIDWRPSVSQQRYRQTVERIRELIARGDTYQVNYTFRLESGFEGEPSDLFAAMCTAQRARYCAWVDIGRFAICSASPELFFARQGERIVSRPMKGTAKRGRYPVEDAESIAHLSASEKERAENLMIVDMMRNDLGRIAIPGSVEVEDLFTVETYPTVHQLTSTVSARTHASHSQVLQALFPSASITGAPKVSTSQIIRQLETGPRGVYTGSIGFFAPNRRAQLNVAIRTAMIDRDTPREGSSATATYGTGGGIVWDSGSDAEYQECRAKALVLNPPPPEFALLETLLWRPKSGSSAEGDGAERGPKEYGAEGGPTGYVLLDRHLDRLLASAQYFAFPLTRTAVIRALEAWAAAFQPACHRVRLVAYRDARLEITAEPWSDSGRFAPPAPRHPAPPKGRIRHEGEGQIKPGEECDPEGSQGKIAWTLELDDRPIDNTDPFLFHKTTSRDLYDQALRRHPSADEVVLWNARGELTETSRANLVLKFEEKWLTPPVSCGLLAGTYRAELLARGQIHEQILPIAAFEEAEEMFLINSVRGWVKAALRPATTAPAVLQIG